jgi:hypothetical protein
MPPTIAAIIIGPLTAVGYLLFSAPNRVQLTAIHTLQ